ncbi:MAG: hypothetical protein VX909_00270 [Candidatus Thermoplasmatota archaeon]|nr:hypothetical protein [Candidatus Thermoplasmatota archaeon]
MSDDVQNKRRLVAIAVIGLLLIVLTAKLLFTVETSLNEGRGPGLEGESSLATIPLMALLAALLGVLFLQLRNGPLRLVTQDTRIAALMAAMFLIGMLIEPLLVVPHGLVEADAIGTLLVLVPIALIAVLLRYHSQGSREPPNASEEE